MSPCCFDLAAVGLSARGSISSCGVVRTSTGVVVRTSVRIVVRSVAVTRIRVASVVGIACTTGLGIASRCRTGRTGGITLVCTFVSLHHNFQLPSRTYLSERCTGLRSKSYLLRSQRWHKR